MAWDVTAWRWASSSPWSKASGSIAADLRLPGVIDVPVERFEELVGAALDGIPPELGRLMDNVAVFVQEGSHSSGLLGLYEGIPLTKRDRGYEGMVMPDRITIFRLPILARCRSEAEVVRQVQITVVHEVGHHFGIGDARLHELGWA
jgi:predicted Zn-dependent protease with MMP-like domain